MYAFFGKARREGHVRAALFRLHAARSLGGAASPASKRRSAPAPGRSPSQIALSSFVIAHLTISWSSSTPITGRCTRLFSPSIIQGRPRRPRIWRQPSRASTPPPMARCARLRIMRKSLSRKPDCGGISDGLGVIVGPAQAGLALPIATRSAQQEEIGRGLRAG